MYKFGVEDNQNFCTSQHTIKRVEIWNVKRNNVFLLQYISNEEICRKYKELSQIHWLKKEGKRTKKENMEKVLKRHYKKDQMQTANKQRKMAQYRQSPGKFTLTSQTLVHTRPND